MFWFFFWQLTNWDEEFCFFIPSGDLVELLFLAWIQQIKCLTLEIAADKEKSTWVSAENLSLYPDPVRAIELLKSPETIERDIRQVFVDCVELLPWLSFLCKKY